MSNHCRSFYVYRKTRVRSQNQQPVTAKQTDLLDDEVDIDLDPDFLVERQERNFAKLPTKVMVAISKI
jgi:hypothetical protein